MTNPIQAAIEKAEEAIRKALLTYGLLSQDFQARLASPMQLAESLAAVMLVVHSQLAALVREYGHKAGCGCIAPTVKPTTPGYRDPRCLPESHVGRSLDEVIREKYPNGLPESREEKP